MKRDDFVYFLHILEAITKDEGYLQGVDDSMSVYMVIESRVQDAAAYGQYLQRVAPIVTQYGGHYLVRGGKVTALGGGWNPERVIILEFPSAENVRQWLSSPEYREIAPLRVQGAETKAVLLEGVTAEE